MTRIGVLADPQGWYFQDLSRAAAARAVMLQPLSMNDLACELGGGEAEVFTTLATEAGGRCSLRDFDAVLIRTMPLGTLEEIILRMDLLAVAESAGTRIINPPKAMETAIDKFLTSARLSAAGILTPPTVACQSLEVAMSAVERWQSVVVKPLFGGEGRGIFRLDDLSIADRTFRMLLSLGSVLYLQPFLQPVQRESQRTAGRDYRLFVLAASDFRSAQVLGMERTNPLDWRANVSRGGAGRQLEMTDELYQLALRSAQAIGAPFAAVDILPAEDGKLYVLEVNAVPGWKGLAAATGVDVAGRIVDWLLM